jgi:hypothetical protein
MIEIGPPFRRGNGLLTESNWPAAFGEVNLSNQQHKIICGLQRHRGVNILLCTAITTPSPGDPKPTREGFWFV